MIQRFDYLVRTERYFTATLLPAVLFHNNLRGVQRFVELVEKNAKTERDRSGDLVRPKGTPNYGDFDDVEIITEFHIARDLDFAHLPLETNVAPGEESEPERRDAPDLVITAGQELVVCEGKFFDRFNPHALNKQLFSQRQQVRHLWLNRPQIRAYRQVAIVPEALDDVDADAVLTWDHVCQLAEELMGSDHYVTARLSISAEI